MKNDPSLIPEAHQTSSGEFCVEIRVRYPETDPMGVVHHSHFFEYFEMARVEHLRRHGIAYRDLEKEGTFFAVVKAACHLRSPAYYDDIVAVTLPVDHSYSIRRKADQKLLAEGNTTLVCLDADLNPKPIPEVIMAIFRGKKA